MDGQFDIQESRGLVAKAMRTLKNAQADFRAIKSQYVVIARDSDNFIVNIEEVEKLTAQLTELFGRMQDIESRSMLSVYVAASHLKSAQECIAKKPPDYHRIQADIKNAMRRLRELGHQLKKQKPLTALQKAIRAEKADALYALVCRSDNILDNLSSMLDHAKTRSQLKWRLSTSELALLKTIEYCAICPMAKLNFDMSQKHDISPDIVVKYVQLLKCYENLLVKQYLYMDIYLSKSPKQAFEEMFREIASSNDVFNRMGNMLESEGDTDLLEQFLIMQKDHDDISDDIMNLHSQQIDEVGNAEDSELLNDYKQLISKALKDIKIDVMTINSKLVVETDDINRLLDEFVHSYNEFNVAIQKPEASIEAVDINPLGNDLESPAHILGMHQSITTKIAAENQQEISRQRKQLGRDIKSGIIAHDERARAAARANHGEELIVLSGTSSTSEAPVTSASLQIRKTAKKRQMDIDTHIIMAREQGRKEREESK